MGPIPNTATVSMPDTPSRFWVLYWVPIMSVDTAAASKLIASGIGMAVDCRHHQVLGIAAIDVEADALPFTAQHPVAAQAPPAAAASERQVDGHPVALAERP